MEGIIEFPTRSLGLAIDNVSSEGNRCAELKNFISDENGIYLRKGKDTGWQQNIDNYPNVPWNNDTWSPS